MTPAFSVAPCNNEGEVFAIGLDRRPSQVLVLTRFRRIVQGFV